MKKIILKSVLALTLGLFATTMVTAKTIKIGVAGPITGANAAFGEQLVKGAEQAVVAINAKGGINGKKIELVLGDDACEPKQAVAVANKFVDSDNVVAVIGHFCSSNTIPATEIYNDAGIIAITPASTNPKVTERGLDLVFRTCGRDDQQGGVAGDLLVNKLKAKRIAVIHDKDTYGQGLADETRAKMAKLGVKDVLYEGLTRGEKDFNALVTKIKSMNVDAVYFGGLHTEAGVLVRQMREQGLDVPFVSGDGIVSKDFYSTSGGNTQNVYMTFLPDPREFASGKSVVEKFEKSGYSPEGFTLFSYAAMEVLAEALGKNKMNSEKAAAYIKTNKFKTVLGGLSFDSKGDPQGSGFVVYKWNKDNYEMM